MKINSKNFRVREGHEVDLKSWPTKVDPVYKSKEQYKKILEEHVAQLSSQQELLHASNRYAVLLIFQAMDAAGKDGAIKHVMSGVNPQGCQVFSFKHPSAAELEHDFLWRTTRNLPERGRIGIFNRSYYEEVLIARVHPVILRSEAIPDTPHHDKKLWPDRYRSIVDLERHLHVNGTRIIASAQGRQGRPSTLYQHLPQVFAASFSDAEQARFTSCRRLPRDKPKPRGEVATPRESLCITDGRDKRSCVKRANPGNARQPAGGLVPFCLDCEFGVECRNPFVQRQPPRQHVLNQELDTRA